MQSILEHPVVDTGHWFVVLVFETNFLILKNTFQVGSNTWLKHFLKLLPSDRQKQYLNKTKLYTAGILKEFKIKRQLPDLQPTVELINYFKSNNYLTFSFVRHPFDRLVSAYRWVFEK